LRLPTRAVRRLIESIRLSPDEVIVDLGSQASLAGRLAETFPKARVFAVVGDAALAARVRQRVPSAVTVLVADSLEDVPEPAVVVLAPTGFEGRVAVRLALEESLRRLIPGGQLYLVAATRRGAARLIEDIRAVFGDAQVLDVSGGFRVARAVKTREPASVEAATGGFEARIDGRSLRFKTTAALFSKEGVDPGTRLLLDHIDRPRVRGTLVDLGCGYGVIGIALALRHADRQVVLVDSNVSAVRAARQSVELSGARNARVDMADGLSGLRAGSAALVVSHVPLHVPEAERRRLFDQCRRVLRPGGLMWVVALASYDVASAIAQSFGDVEVVAERSGYRVLRSRRP
jgi:16S rRNA (guanine1207-N2)-methyltransferase